MPVKVLDAGGTLLLSGGASVDVEAALSDHLARGAKLVTATVRVGAAWVAACTIPTRSFDADKTTTLNLADAALAAQARAPKARVELEECAIEEFGLKRIVSGTTRQQVQECIDGLKERGGQLVGEIEQDGDLWHAVLDTAGSSYRWQG